MPPEETTLETIPEVSPEITSTTESVPVEEPAISTTLTTTPIPEEVIPTELAPQISSVPVELPTLRAKLSSLLATARNLIQTHRNQKLEKIVAFALNQKAKGKSVTNDDAEKLLHVSDRSASRYLNVLVKQGRLKVSGHKKGATYEISG